MFREEQTLLYAREMNDLQKIPKEVISTAKVMKPYMGKRFLSKAINYKNPDVAERLGDYMSKNGGKYIRPAYVFATAMALGKFSPENLDGRIDAKTMSIFRKFLPAAISLQYDHNRFLMHDDPEDYGLLRRGEPAYHVVHGLDFGINDGDYLDVISENVLVNSNDIFGNIWSGETRDRIIDARTRMQERTVFGQNYEFTKRDQHIGMTTVNDVIKILEMKTGYTTETPVRYGCIISGKSDRFIEGLARLMLDATISFQIRDDLLNILSDKASSAGKSNLKDQNMGKDWAGDLDEGKRTLPLVLAYQRASAKDRKFIEQHISSRGPYMRLGDMKRKYDFNDPSDAMELTKLLFVGNEKRKLPNSVKERIIEIEHECGAIQDSKKIMMDYLNRANEGLKLKLGKAAGTIIQMNNFAVYRNF